MLEWSYSPTSAMAAGQQTLVAVWLCVPALCVRARQLALAVLSLILFYNSPRFSCYLSLCHSSFLLSLRLLPPPLLICREEPSNAVNQSA